MLIITIKADVPAGQVIGLKEQVAMALEGIQGIEDIRVVEIRDEKQMSLL